MTWQRVLIDGRLQRRFVPDQQPLPPFLFDEQRKQCERCVFHKKLVNAHGGAELLCQLRGQLTCSLARTSGHECGPDAARFKAIRPLTHTPRSKP